MCHLHSQDVDVTLPSMVAALWTMPRNLAASNVRGMCVRRSIIVQQMSVVNSDCAVDVPECEHRHAAKHHRHGVLVTANEARLFDRRPQGEPSCVRITFEMLCLQVFK